LFSNKNVKINNGGKSLKQNKKLQLTAGCSAAFWELLRQKVEKHQKFACRLTKTQKCVKI